MGAFISSTLWKRLSKKWCKTTIQLRQMSETRLWSLLKLCSDTDGVKTQHWALHSGWETEFPQLLYRQKVPRGRLQANPDPRKRTVNAEVLGGVVSPDGLSVTWGMEESKLRGSTLSSTGYQQYSLTRGDEKIKSKHQNPAPELRQSWWERAGYGGDL